MIACRTLLIWLLLSNAAMAQHQWQKPKPLKAKSEVSRIIGPLSMTQPAKPIHIVWVWGFDKWHRPGAHDYERVRDLMTGLLAKVPKVTVEAAYEFPSKALFEKADLVCMYLHLPQLSAAQFADFQAFIEGGGAVVSLHETCIIRPSGEGLKLAHCLGRAWNEGKSKWGAIFADLTVDNSHEVFRGFPGKLPVVDEFYWGLHQKQEGVDILATVPVGPARNSKGPIPEERLSEKQWPVVWTHEMGKGRVFATSTGHHTFTYYDPEFRIILFRGMAWALKQKADPFMPLVFKGITNAGHMVGTTDTMRDWKGKRRGK